MFHERSTNNLINSLHERALRMVYRDLNLSFEELLKVNNSFSVHHRNIQTLAIELYKQKNSLSPDIIDGCFGLVVNGRPNTRKNNPFRRVTNSTVHYGDYSLRSFGPIVWDMLPSAVKQAENLEKFKALVRDWEPKNCTCRLCKTYIQGVGFV